MTSPIVLIVSPSLDADGRKAYGIRGRLFDAYLDGQLVVSRSTPPLLDAGRALVVDGLDAATPIVMRHAGYDALHAKFGDMPIKALADRRARGVFMDWRDELALKSPRQADYTWTVLAPRTKDRGKIPTNPCERGGRVYRGTRVDHVWSIEDEERFLLPPVRSDASPFGAVAGFMDRAAPG